MPLSDNNFEYNILVSKIIFLALRFMRKIIITLKIITVVLML